MEFLPPCETSPAAKSEEKRMFSQANNNLAGHFYQPTAILRTCLYPMWHLVFVPWYSGVDASALIWCKRCWWLEPTLPLCRSKYRLSLHLSGKKEIQDKLTMLQRVVNFSIHSRAPRWTENCKYIFTVSPPRCRACPTLNCNQHQQLTKEILGWENCHSLRASSPFGGCRLFSHAN